MRLVQIINYLLRHLSGVVKLCLAMLGLMVVVDTLLNMVQDKHAHTWIETNVPGFWALFGLVGCILLILVSKWFGHRGIMTREDYYDE